MSSPGGHRAFTDVCAFTHENSSGPQLPGRASRDADKFPLARSTPASSVQHSERAHFGRELGHIRKWHGIELHVVRYVMHVLNDANPQGAHDTSLFYNTFQDIQRS